MLLQRNMQWTIYARTMQIYANYMAGRRTHTDTQETMALPTSVGDSSANFHRVNTCISLNGHATVNAHNSRTTCFPPCRFMRSWRNPRLNYGPSPVATSHICPCGWLVGRCCRSQRRKPALQPPSLKGHEQRNLHAVGLSSSLRLHSLSSCPILHMSVPGLSAVFTYIFNPSRSSHSRWEPRIVTGSSSRTGTQRPKSSSFL